MDLKNISTIMDSKLWKRIIHHPSYKGYTIVHPSKRETPNQNVYCALWIFFDYKITDKTIRRYWKEGKIMIRTELLDQHKLPILCYGKTLVYS